MTGDDHTGEGLNTGVVAFLDLHVHVDGIACAELGDLLGRLQVLGIKCFNSVNHCYSSVTAAYQCTGWGICRMLHACSIRCICLRFSSGLPFGGVPIRRSVGLSTRRLDLKEKRDYAASRLSAHQHSKIPHPQDLFDCVSTETFVADRPKRQASPIRALSTCIWHNASKRRNACPSYGSRHRHGIRKAPPAHCRRGFQYSATCWWFRSEIRTRGERGRT